MNYNQYSNPKATQASRNLAIATLLIALIGIIGVIMILMSGKYILPALLILIAILALVLCRPMIEAKIVERIIQEDDSNAT